MSLTQWNASSRRVAENLYVLYVLRIPLLITVLVIGVISDALAGGVMRESLRFSLQEAPYRILFVAPTLLLLCWSLRFMSEAIVRLVTPDLVERPRAGRLARWLPRLMPLSVGLAYTPPVLGLAMDPGLFADQPLLRVNAFGSALTILAIAVFVTLFPSGPRMAEDATRRPTPSLKLLSVTLVLLVTISFAAALLGLLQPNSGLAAHVVERYLVAVFGFWDRFIAPDRAIPHLKEVLGFSEERYLRYMDGPPDFDGHVAWLQIAAEFTAMFVAGVALRWAIAIIFDIIKPKFAVVGPLHHAIRNLLPRAATILFGLIVAAQVLGPYVLSSHPIARDPRERAAAVVIAAAFLIMAIVASQGRGSSSALEGNWEETQSVGRRVRLALERISAMDVGWRRFFKAMIVLGIGVAVFFTVEIASYSDISVPRILGPTVLIMLAGLTLVAIGGPLTIVGSLARIPVFTTLVIAALTYEGFGVNNNHALRGSDRNPGSGPQFDQRDVFDLGAWMASRPDWRDYDRYPVFLVATEGGGLRAAYFTAATLAAIQERCPSFSTHTMALSGVSGGSLGLATFAAAMADPGQPDVALDRCLEGRPPGSLSRRVRAGLSQDMLSPLVAATLFPDALQRIVPAPVHGFDRTRALEFAIEEGWRDAAAGCSTCDPDRMAENAARLYADPATRARVPYLFLNATEVNTGRSIPYATARAPQLATPFTDQAQVDQTDYFALAYNATLQDLMPADHVPLSAAALISARFPYLTPAGQVNGLFHYVDGGYFENSGTWLMSGLVQNLLGQQRAYRNPDNPELERAVQRATFITIVIRSKPCRRIAQSEACHEPYLGSDNRWAEFLSPVRALMRTRDKRADYSVSDLSAMAALIQQLTGPRETGTRAVGGRIDDSQCNYSLCTVILSYNNSPKVEVPVTWVLSRSSREAMDEAADGLATVNAIPALAGGREFERAVAGHNTVNGSYRRVFCLLERRRGPGRCEPAPASGAAGESLGLLTPPVSAGSAG